MIRNKRRAKIRRKADNEFTKLTGFPVVRLTGPKMLRRQGLGEGCWVTDKKSYKAVSVHKASYAIHNGYHPAEIKRPHHKMKSLTVTQTCGCNQCVNPAHLRGTVKDYNPAIDGYTETKLRYNLPNNTN